MENEWSFLTNSAGTIGYPYAKMRNPYSTSHLILLIFVGPIFTSLSFLISVICVFSFFPWSIQMEVDIFLIFIQNQVLVSLILLCAIFTSLLNFYFPDCFAFHFFPASQRGSLDYFQDLSLGLFFF